MIELLRKVRKFARSSISQHINDLLFQVRTVIWSLMIRTNHKTEQCLKIKLDWKIPKRSVDLQNSTACQLPTCVLQTATLCVCEGLRRGNTIVLATWEVRIIRVGVVVLLRWHNGPPSLSLVFRACGVLWASISDWLLRPASCVNAHGVWRTPVSSASPPRLSIL